LVVGCATNVRVQGYGIRAHADKIDFKDFQGILSNIAAAIDAHALELTGTVTP